MTNPARVPLGSSGLEVLPLSFGGNVFGWTADEATSFQLLDAYTAAGGNFIDTADVYSAWKPGNSGGESEEIIGRWLASRGRPDDLVIATKVGAHEAAKGTSRDSVRRGVEASLRRLGVDAIDLYYAHVDDQDTPIEETVTALAELVAEGKVRAIGASNFTAERLQAALDVSAREGIARFEVLQNRYNLVARDDYEGELADLLVREASDPRPTRASPAASSPASTAAPRSTARVPEPPRSTTTTTAEPCSRCWTGSPRPTASPSRRCRSPGSGPSRRSPRPSRARATSRSCLTSSLPSSSS
ncbi:hypothetical protein MAFF212519_18650 [Clavibacter michiganensis]